MHVQRMLASTARRASSAVARRRPSLREERGASAVEFAIVATVLFLLVFGIIDFGFGFHTWNGTANAAREGARRAAVDPNQADIIATTKKAVDYLDPALLSITITCSHGGAFATCGPESSWLDGDYVRVTVDYRYQFMTPIGSMVGMGDGLTLHSTSEARYEG